MRERRKPKKQPSPKTPNLPIPKEEIKPYIPESPYNRDFKNRPGCGC